MFKIGTTGGGMGGGVKGKGEGGGKILLVCIGKGMINEEGN